MPNPHANSRHVSTGQLVLIALACLPFLASFGFSAVARKPNPLTDSIERPALVFDQYLVNLTDNHNNLARVEGHYRFKNCGSFPVRITKLTPSCGCLTPHIEKRAYAPGEIYEFSLTVLTTHQAPGPHEYELKIDYEDPKPRSVTVAFKLVVRREVTLQPSALIFWQNGTAETEQKVVVTDMRPKPFHVTSATCRSKLVKAELAKQFDDPEGGRETTVSIKVAAQVPTGGEDCSVTLTTDDPHYPRIPIPLRIRDLNSKESRKAAAEKDPPAVPGSKR